MQSAKTRPGADCGSDHQLLIAKFNWLLYHCNTHDIICTSFPKLALGDGRVPVRGCVVKQQYKIHTEPHPFFLPFVSPNGVFLFLNVDLLYKLTGI